MPRARSIIGSTLIAAALAAGGADVAAAPTPQSSPEASTAVAQPRRPAAVREWLGRWVTNGSGALTVYDAIYIPARKFTTRCPCTWSLIARWSHPGGTTAIVRGVLSSDNLTYSAGYPVPGGATGTIRAARRGTRFSGFWKPCRTFCRTTKWSANRTAKLRLYRVGFRFTQSGRPAEHTTIATRTGGAGAAWFLGAAPESEGRGFPSAGLRTFHIDVIPEGVDLRLDAEPEGFIVYQTERGGRDVLVIGLKVTESNDPKCEVGEHARLTLSDGHGRGLDRIRLAFTGEDSDCPHDESWQSADPDRVNVVIGPVERE